MVDEYFVTNFQRLRELKLELKEVSEQYQTTKERLESLTMRYGSLERLMNAEVHAKGDEALGQQLKAILEDRPVTEVNPVSNEDLTKFDFLIGILFREGLSGKGVSPKELFQIAQSLDPEKGITLMNANDVLSKSKKRGMVEQKYRLYYLTDSGRAYWSKLSN